MPRETNDGGAPSALPALLDLRDDTLIDFALWLVPRGDDRRLWAERIAELAEALGGPAFAPHVTLFGSFRRSLAEALVLTEALGRDLAPIPLRGRGVGLRPDRWQALFVPLALNPELWRARCAISDALAPGEPVEYFPHLSLFYGDLPAASKCAAVARLDPLPDIDWCVRELVLVALVGAPDTWSVEAILPLRG